jgi:alkylhydroperoxidase family enzyme
VTWEAVRRDWRTAPVDEPLRVTLGFLEKLTLRPDELRLQDAEAVLATGVREDALVDAIHIAALFSMIVRLADSFGWHVPLERELAAGAGARLGSSYALLTASEVG